jgi:D-alanyl-D-alanine carboxypeptidase
VGEIFPDLAKTFHPAAAKITVEQLLSHRSGLPGNPPLRRLDALYTSKLPVIEQRLALPREALSKKPKDPPATGYDYSNLGYILVGAICERITGKPWEEALAEQVLTPLGITHFGFGAPGSPGALDQPRGHQSRLFRSYRAVEPGPDADNPPVLGPAGTLHISIVDWMRFAQDQLKGETGGGKLLTSATYQRLHTPLSGSVYALGWGVITVKGGIKSIQHAGSNGSWLALVSLLPSCNALMVFTANDGTSRGEDAIGLARDAALDPATGLCPNPSP